jgi:hypothetical protein
LIPLTHDLVKGLSEVFCLTDPTKPDNPIIYASPEFYSLRRYPRDKVIGYNWTDRERVKRLKAAIEKGEEICETLMNYTQDGKPFVNLFLLAPLRDGKGKVRYYLEAHVDCSVLVEGRRGVEAFEIFLLKREMQAKEAGKDAKGTVLERLRVLSSAFDLEECAVVRSSSRHGSTSAVGENKGGFSKQRRITDEDRLGSEDDDSDSETEKSTEKWKLAGDEKSGRLPGLYKYSLVWPYPSLRMIFVSRAARKFGKLQQRRFLAHVAAPPSTLSGLKELFESGTPVTAKIALMDHADESKEGKASGRWGERGEDPAEKGNMCWISATPLLDAENNVGVWMVVIVDERSAASNRNRVPSALSKRQDLLLDTITKAQSLEQTYDKDEDKMKQGDDADESRHQVLKMRH